MSDCIACGEPNKGPICFSCQLDASFPEPAEDDSEMDEYREQETDW